VIAQELFANSNIGIRKVLRVDSERFFVETRFAKVLAIERAENVHFALIAAADRANIALNSRATAPRPPRVTDSTQFRHEPSG
jgi:hypothetical protein